MGKSYCLLSGCSIHWQPFTPLQQCLSWHNVHGMLRRCPLPAVGCARAAARCCWCWGGCHPLRWGVAACHCMHPRGGHVPGGLMTAAYSTAQHTNWNGKRCDPPMCRQQTEQSAGHCGCSWAVAHILLHTFPCLCPVLGIQPILIVVLGPVTILIYILVSSSRACLCCMILLCMCCMLCWLRCWRCMRGCHRLLLVAIIRITFMQFLQACVRHSSEGRSAAQHCIKHMMRSPLVASYHCRLYVSFDKALKARRKAV